MRIGKYRIELRKDRLRTLTIHLLIVYLLLGMLGVSHLFDHPIVLGAICLSYYDLWIK